MNIFDDNAGDYAEIMDKTVGWVGQDHDYFIGMKTRLLVRLLRRYRGDPKRATVLDVGCGVGLIDSHLAGSVGALHGIDISDESIAIAAQSCPGAEFLVYDGNRIPHPDNMFDLAFAACVLHHVPPSAWEGFVAEMARVLKPGGIAVVLEHNPINPVTRHIVKNHPLDRGAVMMPRGVCLDMMRQAGLRIAEKSYTTFLPFPVPGIERLLGWIPLGAQYFAAAVKA